MRRHLSQHPDFPGLLNPIKIIFTDLWSAREEDVEDLISNGISIPVYRVVICILLAPVFVVLTLLFSLIRILSFCFDMNLFMNEPVLFVHDGTVYRAQLLRWRSVTALDRAGRGHVFPLKQCFLPEASHLPQLEAWGDLIASAEATSYHCCSWGSDEWEAFFWKCGRCWNKVALGTARCDTCGQSQKWPRRATPEEVQRD